MRQLSEPVLFIGSPLGRMRKPTIKDNIESEESVCKVRERPHPSIGLREPLLVNRSICRFPSDAIATALNKREETGAEV